MSFLHTWNATELDLTAEGVRDKLDAPLLVCKEILNDVTAQKLKVKRQCCYRCHQAPRYMAQAQEQSFGVPCRSKSLPEAMGNPFPPRFVHDLLVTVQNQHPHKAGADLLDQTRKLPRDEVYGAQRTPPHAAHSTSLTPLLVREVQNDQDCFRAKPSP